jgi:hypothetical protein
MNILPRAEFSGQMLILPQTSSPPFLRLRKDILDASETGKATPRNLCGGGARIGCLERQVSDRRRVSAPHLDD